jgi:phage terminase Nu1 subunit (DNA packaging protein)
MFTSQAKFAAMRGVSTRTVGQWGHRGLLVKNHDGLVDIEATNAALDSARNPSKARDRGHAHELKNGKPGKPEAKPTAKLDTSALPSYSDSMRQKAAADARLSTMKADAASGKLIPSDQMVRVMAYVIQVLTIKLKELPSRLAPRIHEITGGDLSDIGIALDGFD